MGKDADCCQLTAILYGDAVEAQAVLTGGAAGVDQQNRAD